MKRNKVWKKRFEIGVRRSSAVAVEVFVMNRSILMLAAFILVAVSAYDASACEPRHELKLFEGAVKCQVGELVCDKDPSGDPINCRRCTPNAPEPGGLCWASDCRTFGGKDKGQFAQFKKQAKGELEAIIMTVTNQDTGDSHKLVATVASPDCGALIPAPSGGSSCTTVYKIKGIKPDGKGQPLCTWDNLDDVNTVTLTPKSAGVTLTDVNGKECDAVKKPGQYWIFYQDCCGPSSLFGAGGDSILTETEYVVEDNGQCTKKTARTQSEPEFFPTEAAEPCS